MNPSYSFLVPLTSWAWAHHIGWRPLVLVTQGVQKLVRHAAVWAGAEVLEVPHGGWPAKTLMQVARILSAAALEHDDDVLTTSDADMLPLGAAYFNALNMSQADVHVQGFHEAALPYKQYPICYVTMTAGTWRRVMNISRGQNLTTAMAALLRNGMPWEYDQILLYNASQAPGVRVKLYDGFSSQRRHNLPSRDCAHDPGCVQGTFIDSHLPRPTFTKTMWPRLRTLLANMMDNATLEYFDKYRAAFVETIMRGDDVAQNMVDRRWGDYS